MIVLGRTDVQGASIPIGEICLHGVGRAAAVQAASPDGYERSPTVDEAFESASPSPVPSEAVALALDSLATAGDARAR